MSNQNRSISFSRLGILHNNFLFFSDSCKKALAENTDIRFTYEHGKRGLREKWLTIIFHIYKNTDYKEPLELRDFIDQQLEPKDKLVSSPDYVPDVQPPRLPPSSSLSRQPYLSCDFEKDLAPNGF